MLSTLLTIGGPILVEVLRQQSKHDQNVVVTDLANQVSAGMSAMRMIKRDLTALTEPATKKALDDLANQAQAMADETAAIRDEWNDILERRAGRGIER